MNRSRLLGWVLLASVVLLLATLPAKASTDITGVVSDVSGYVTAAVAVGISVLLFVLGRRVVRKLV